MNIDKHKEEIRAIHKDLVSTKNSADFTLERLRLLINSMRGKGFTDEYQEDLETAEVELIEVKHKLHQIAKIVA